MVTNEVRDTSRIKSASAVLAGHALLGYALLQGLQTSVAAPPIKPLKLFDVTVAIPLPPPNLPPVPVSEAASREGAAAPVGLRAAAALIVAPTPRVVLERPSPVIAALLPGVGSEARTGASTQIGSGPGSGGEGNGAGSGRSGSGAGGGGILARAQWVSGGMRNSDYPRAAGRAGIGGAVVTRFTVGTDGRASGCKVTRSSGTAELDATTCRLIEQRFRYRPARDLEGRPISDVMGWKQTWWIEAD